MLKQFHIMKNNHISAYIASNSKSTYTDYKKKALANDIMDYSTISANPNQCSPQTPKGQ